MPATSSRLTRPTASSKAKSTATRAPAKQKRSPDAESTKPRVSKKTTKPAPEPAPSSISESEESASEAEEASDIASADEESENELVPVPKKATASKVTKTKTSRVKVKAPTSSKQAPHMVLFSHSLPFESSPPEARKIAHYIVDCAQPFELNSMVFKILASHAKILKNNRSYNSVSSRLGLALVIVYKILLVLEAAGTISNDQVKALKAIRLIYPAANIMIPSPYLHWLSTLGFHIPEDAKFDKVVPLFPSPSDMYTHHVADKKISLVTGQLAPLCYPSIPHLYAMLEIISSRSEIPRTENNTATTPKSTKVHFTKEGDFCLAARTGFATGSVVYFGHDFNAAPSSGSNTDYIAQNVAFTHPFPESEVDLISVSRNLRPIPIISQDDYPISTTLEMLVAKESVAWMSGPFAALAYEAKFFPGSTTLESLPLSSGPELTCVVTSELSTNLETVWYAPRLYSPRSLSVTTRNRHVTTSHLQIAHSVRMITTNVIKTGVTGSLRKDLSGILYDVKPNGKMKYLTANDPTIFTEGYEQRCIYNAEYILDQYEPSIRSIMSKVSDVL
jgi:hypothetical protein